MNLVKGSNRERIAPEDVAALRLAGTLVQDARRERPRSGSTAISTPPS